MDDSAAIGSIVALVSCCITLRKTVLFLLLACALWGCADRCQAGKTVCGGAYADVLWLP